MHQLDLVDRLVDLAECYRPREGYELHPVNSVSVMYSSGTGYRPREGYELHPENGEIWGKIEGVIVPVRGMSCIRWCFIAGDTIMGVIVPVRGMSCIARKRC